MKAWLVREKDRFCATIVFAETRGKARTLASYCDCCEDARFIDIEARRQPQVDKYYKEGKRYLDWEHPQDRIVLVRDCGFVCHYEYFEWQDCESCSAKEYCDKYNERSEIIGELLGEVIGEIKNEGR